MSTLICNVPPVKVWVRKEYLRDHRDGFGEYELGYWCTVKSLTGRAFYFETFLPGVGCLYDKLPISAFLAWHPDYPDKPLAPDPDLPLKDLQFWNCFDTDVVCLEKNLIYDAAFTVRTRAGGDFAADYLFTLDHHHGDRDRPDLGYAECPEEHKSHNVVQLSNGQFGAYPNNRCRITDESLSPEKLVDPYMLVSTRYYSVENISPKWGRLGAEEYYCWSTPTERESEYTEDEGVG